MTTEYKIAVRQGTPKAQQLEELLQNHGIKFEKEIFSEAYQDYDIIVSYWLKFDARGALVILSAFPEAPIWQRRWMRIHDPMPAPMEGLQAEVKLLDKFVALREKLNAR